MREFNTTGSCVPHMHYMVNIENKLIEIKKLIDGGKYFTINRARQYGKTTTRYALKNFIQDIYTVINISFEGIGDSVFNDEMTFTSKIFDIFADSFKVTNKELTKELRNNAKNIKDFTDLSNAISEFCEKQSKKIVLIIDEVDKSSNNQLFLSFLGMLRDKYISRNNGDDISFQSVILLGVYDVKNLKIKLRADEERKFNSPWNIAAEFEVDMSFNPKEISTMLVEYENDYKTNMDINEISQEIYNYTRGYPFLVSKVCKVIHEKLNKNWTIKGLEEAVKLILNEKNTLFDDLIKNLENYKKLYGLTYDILVEGKQISFNIHTPIIELGVIFGILAEKDTFIGISNKIFEICIYNYMISKRGIEEGELVTYEYRTQFIKNSRLDMTLVLDKFQEVMHDEFREKDVKFLEREGRLLFLCFIKPIINGAGFYYVEPETRMDNRMDVVVTYGDDEHIIELKIWHGENYEQNAISQLAGYLESKRQDKGYLVSFNFNKNKDYTKEWKKYNGKDIYAIVV